MAGGRRPRWAAIAASMAIELALVAGLIFGLSAPATLRQTLSSLATLDLHEPPAPQPARRHAHPGHPAAAARHASAAPLEAPSPQLALPLPGLAAEPAEAGQGVAGGGASSGAGSGDGIGNGSGGGDVEWLKGRIRDADYPRAARDARAEGVTRTRIAIDREGRPTACSVRRSSGSALLDDTTCRLILKRFRFSPARDDGGRAEADSVDYDQSWSISGYMGD